ncbi:MAG: phosphoribosylanthranilate isomerase [Rhodocyclaceae bacterium]|nr:phosphoribosylanthranilate isomerase [Rhodocyclaceae bacterium]
MQRTRVKICGLTRLSDIAEAVAHGADALGFVFYPPSPRALELESAVTLMAQVPAFVTKVGLFVNDSETRIREHLARLPIDLLQFHGDESGDFCSSFGRPWIKAARVGEGFDLLEFSQQYSRFPGIVGVLADACVDGFGGSGKTFDWSLVPEDLPLPLILSGGLTSSNVEEAIRIVKPWAVDVSSGVEPVGGPKGVKCAQEIQRFLAGVHHADEAN